MAVANRKGICCLPHRNSGDSSSPSRVGHRSGLLRHVREVRIEKSPSINAPRTGFGDSGKSGVEDVNLRGNAIYSHIFMFRDGCNTVPTSM